MCGVSTRCYVDSRLSKNRETSAWGLAWSWATGPARSSNVLGHLVKRPRGRRACLHGVRPMLTLTVTQAVLCAPLISQWHQYDQGDSRLVTRAPWSPLRLVTRRRREAEVLRTPRSPQGSAGSELLGARPEERPRGALCCPLRAPSTHRVWERASGLDSDSPPPLGSPRVSVIRAPPVTRGHYLL